MKKLCTLALASLAGSALAIIDFEEVASSGNPILTTLDSQGYRFTSSHFHSIDDPAASALADNGSDVYIGHEGGDLGRAITMIQIGGGLFNLASFDMAELWISSPGAYPNASHVEVHATFSDDSTTTFNLALDGVIDGAGGAADFETAVVNLTNLKSVRFNGVNPVAGGDFAFAIDNIDAAPVPEPATMVALALGAAAMRRRRRS